MAPPAGAAEERLKYWAIATLPILTLYVLQTSGVLNLTLDGLHYVALQLFLIAAFQVQLGLVTPPKGGAAAPAAPAALPAPAAAVAAEATNLEHLEDDAGAADETAVASRHPAMPLGKLPDDPRFTNVVRDMIDAFLATLKSADDPTLWDKKIDTPTLQVFMKRSAIPTFKLFSVMDNTPLTCFDFCSDAVRRKEWDDMTDDARVVETIDRDTRIVYVRTKPIWPTAARDMLLLSHKTVLPDGKLLNVTRSVTHPDCPERTDGVIRMEVGIAGMLCYPSKLRPGMCDMLQIGGGDPKGSIPKSLINFVSTKAVPLTTQRVNEELRKLAPLDAPTAARPRAARRATGAAAGGAAASADVAAALQQVVTKLESLEQRLLTNGAAGGQPSGVLGQVRAVLEWSSPFVIATFYVAGIYVLVRARSSAAQ